MTVCRLGCVKFGDGNKPLNPQCCWACEVSSRLRGLVAQLDTAIAVDELSPWAESQLAEQAKEIERLRELADELSASRSWWQAEAEVVSETCVDRDL